MDHVDDITERESTEENQDGIERVLELLTRKGVYPYQYMDSFARFQEKQLPLKVNN